MDRHDLTESEWNAIRKFLPADRQRKRGRRWCSHREVINGILWILAVGAPWRDLPDRYGNWSTVYKGLFVGDDLAFGIESMKRF